MSSPLCKAPAVETPFPPRSEHGHFTVAITLPAVKRSVPAVRHWLLAALLPSSAADVAELCLSELAGNSVRWSLSHCGGYFTARLAVSPGQWIYLTVEDAGPDPYTPGHTAPLDTYDEYGRGLTLVRDLCGGAMGRAPGSAWCCVPWGDTPDS
jgi:anti-sigma regulatory factor (Ser/Thr protein kinase)